MTPERRVPLGRTGLQVTRLALGTAPLGGLFQPVSDHDAHEVVRHAYELGLRFFDTAPLYGHGLAEERLGRALAERPRGSFIVATKVGRLLRADAPPDPTQFLEGEPYYREVPPLNPTFNFSRAGVLRSLEESLVRLDLERVDVLHVHDPDRHYREVLEEAYPALDQLRAEGVVRAVGAGMNQSEMLVRFAREADFDCFLVAGRYTLLDQGALKELLPLCQAKGIAVIAGGVYNSGILAEPRPGGTFDYVPARPEIVDRAQRLKTACAAYSVPLKAAAIQFPAAHPAVACVLTGARSIAELEENVTMFRHSIPAALWEDLKHRGLIAEAAPVPGSDQEAR